MHSHLHKAPTSKKQESEEAEKAVDLALKQIILDPLNSNIIKDSLSKVSENNRANVCALLEYKLRCSKQLTPALKEVIDQATPPAQVRTISQPTQPCLRLIADRKSEEYQNIVRSLKTKMSEPRILAAHSKTVLEKEFSAPQHTRQGFFTLSQMTYDPFTPLISLSILHAYYEHDLYTNSFIKKLEGPLALVIRDLIEQNNIEALQHIAADYQLNLNKMMLPRPPRRISADGTPESPRCYQAGYHVGPDDGLYGSDFSVAFIEKSTVRVHTPLSYAVHANQYDVVSFLLKEAKVDVHATFGEGRRLMTALHCASTPRMALLLTEHGANIDASENFITPLNYCLLEKRYHMVQTFINLGAKPTPPICDPLHSNISYAYLNNAIWQRQQRVEKEVSEYTRMHPDITRIIACYDVSELQAENNSQLINGRSLRRV